MNGQSNTLSFAGGDSLVSNISGNFLTIDVSNNTYTLLFYDGVPLTVTDTDSCGNTFQNSGKFVLILGIVNLFADMTYEGARSVNGAFLQMLRCNTPFRRERSTLKVY
jgi:hypothetical protein